MEITLNDLKSLLNVDSFHQQSNITKANPYKTGKMYAIRTVTMVYTGILAHVYDQELVLKDCHWIAETARWNTFISDMVTNEHESYGAREVIIGKGTIVDACIVDKLPIGNK